MCTVPVGAAVYYFPQVHGHAELAGAAVDLRTAHVPPFLSCRVVAVRLMDEPDTDDIFARHALSRFAPGSSWWTWATP